MLDQKHTEKVIDYHKRRLQKLKEAKALRGINTPPEILIEIEDIETELAALLNPAPAVSGSKIRSHGLLGVPVHIDGFGWTNAVLLYGLIKSDDPQAEQE